MQLEKTMQLTEKNGKGKTKRKISRCLAGVLLYKSSKSTRDQSRCLLSGNCSRRYVILPLLSHMKVLSKCFSCFTGIENKQNP